MIYYVVDSNKISYDNCVFFTTIHYSLFNDDGGIQYHKVAQSLYIAFNISIHTHTHRLVIKFIRNINKNNTHTQTNLKLKNIFFKFYSFPFSNVPQIREKKTFRKPYTHSTKDQGAKTFIMVNYSWKFFYYYTKEFMTIFYFVLFTYLLCVCLYPPPLRSLIKLIVIWSTTYLST